MYSLLAKEIKHIKPNNIFYNPIAYKDLKKETNYNINDPFEWLKVLDDYKTLDEKKYKYYKRRFNTIETQGHMAIIQAKYDKFKKSYFPLPYQKYLKKLPKKRQALIYALGRQESRFVPTSISPSYANGVMQIMPFLSKALAKQLKDKYDIDKQLTAKTNLRYADFHLNYLTSRLDNVLFVAYAYNGGIGFTTRMLKNSGLFKTKRQYEPFLSMELVHYDESREYGKKVLTNYYVYNNYLRKDIKFSSLFENLRSPY
jgi:soluble lytic murein transglycosylase